MTERFRYEPITEPSVPPPILDPELFPLEPAEFNFTRKQREAILERDKRKCQGTVPHGHNYHHPLEVDHIIPQRYGHDQGIPDEVLDAPENLLTKCINAHDLKHRDRISTLDKYRGGNKQAYKEMFEERHEKLDNGDKYWDDTYDASDYQRALKLTEEARRKGWVYPQKRVDD